MKHQADKNRSEREFSVGGMVYMKLQPYVQSTVMSRANQKLSFKYFGPFCVLERVGAVAYRLQLPENCQIHPVVHVSQPKLAYGFKGVVSSDLQLTLRVIVFLSNYSSPGLSLVAPLKSSRC
jgi:hypothetical protein